MSKEKKIMSDKRVQIALLLLLIFVGFAMAYAIAQPPEPTLPTWEFVTRTCDFLDVLGETVVKCIDGSEWLVNPIGE